MHNRKTKAHQKGTSSWADLTDNYVVNADATASDRYSLSDWPSSDNYHVLISGHMTATQCVVSNCQRLDQGTVNRIHVWVQRNDVLARHRNEFCKCGINFRHHTQNAQAITELVVVLLTITALPASHSWIDGDQIPHFETGNLASQQIDSANSLMAHHLVGMATARMPGKPVNIRTADSSSNHGYTYFVIGRIARCTIFYGHFPRTLKYKRFHSYSVSCVG